MSYNIKKTTTFDITRVSSEDILNGNVGIMNTDNVCHIDTIDWSELLSGSNTVKHRYCQVFAKHKKLIILTRCSFYQVSFSDGHRRKLIESIFE